MENFTDIPSSQQLKDSLTPLMNNFKTIRSHSSGVAFPTANLQVGQTCLRTDLGSKGQLYELADTTPTWVLIADLGKTYLSQETADTRYLTAATTLNTLAAPIAAVAMNAQKITGLADPTSAQDAATKNYVDALKQALDVKQHCRVLITANVNLANPGTAAFDSVSLNNGDRVLVIGQTTASQNGIYTFASSSTPMVRADDADVSAKVKTGLYTWITEGTINGDSGWILITTGAITLGTSALSFVQFSGAGMVLAGAGITKTGNTLSLTPVNPTGAGIKVTVDTYGRVTALAALTAADIPGTAWTHSTLTAVSQLTNDSNYAVRGENISEFTNNSGYITIGGYNTVGSYAIGGAGPGGFFAPTSPGATGAASGLSGTWMCMGVILTTLSCCGSGTTVLLQRIA